MNKAELVAELADALNIPKTHASQNVDALLTIVSNALARGNKVQLVGFGSFSVVHTAARKGRNPRTGESLKIVAAKKVRFSVGSKLRADVNTKKKAVGKKTPKAK